MAQLLLGSLVFLLSYCVVPVPAPYCDSDRYGYSYDWTCPSDYECCYSSAGCCEPEDERATRASYWYAWFLIALIFLMCVCGCIGCGGYRRYYQSSYHVVRRVECPPPPRARVVTRTAVPPPALAYPEATPGKLYSPYGIPKDPPPPYTPSVPPPSYKAGQY